MSSIEYSLIVPARCSQEELNRFLDNLARVPGEPSWELIVVDDFSDELLKLGKDRPKTWKILRLQKQSGAARARNAGAMRAQGRHLNFLSVFLTPPQFYLQKTEEFIKTNEFDYAQYPFKPHKNTATSWFQRFVSDHTKRTKPRAGQLSIKQSLFGAALIKRSLFNELGGFDENMNHYGGHEMDFIYRMAQKGYRRRVLIDNTILERTRIPDYHAIIKRLREYGSAGLPSLLSRHPELKTGLLPAESVFKLLWQLKMTQAAEKILGFLVRQNLRLPGFAYRLFLHLIMRNAWTAR